MPNRKIVHSGGIGNPHQARVKPDNTRRKFNTNKKVKK